MVVILVVDQAVKRQVIFGAVSQQADFIIITFGLEVCHGFR